MLTKTQLRRPENWQDFETLCKKLWGEIWKCPEIKKNGRQGQPQCGVDIYGKPYGETEYFGIQCKGKDEYAESQLTEKEIDEEIEKATHFVPKLKKLYFATTATKSAKIEEYVRTKDIANVKIGLFEVHLFSWEDIVELIDENKQTYDFYVKNINFRTEYDTKFVFNNNENELAGHVIFQKRVTSYSLKTAHDIFYEYVYKTPQYLLPHNTYDIASLMNPNSKINNSCYRFNFKLFNLGNAPLREFKILLNFEGDFESINTCDKHNYFTKAPSAPYDTFFDGNNAKIVPLRKILVKDDSLTFDTIYIKPHKSDIETETDIRIYWKLISIDYQTEGDLLLKVITTFKILKERIPVENASEVKTEEHIEDYITSSRG